MIPTRSVGWPDGFPPDWSEEGKSAAPTGLTHPGFSAGLGVHLPSGFRQAELTCTGAAFPFGSTVNSSGFPVESDLFAGPSSTPRDRT